MARRVKKRARCQEGVKRRVRSGSRKKEEEATVSSKGEKEEREKKPHAKKTDNTQTSMDESDKNSKLAAQ